jgi:glycosyltransferase involved in cell wall biosynthesis
MKTERQPGTVLMIAYTYYESDPRVIREAEAALEAGFDVDFLALRRGDQSLIEDVRGVRVIRLNQSRYRGSNAFRYLASYCEFFLRSFVQTSLLWMKKRHQVIHVNNMPDFLVFCALIPRLLGAKVILDIHDPMPNTFASKYKHSDSGLIYKLLLLQERLSAAFSHRVVTVHHPVRDGILLKHGLRDDSIEVIANFADNQLFQPRSTFHVGNKIRFIFHGTILERSGLKILVEALSRVRHQDRICVKIIGEGDFAEPLKLLIQSMGLQKVVKFDNFNYPVRQIPELIAECNVGLVPLVISSVTNFALPLKLLEYISMGLPVISVRSTAISYYFQEDDCLFYNWDDPEGLARLINNLVEYPQLIHQFRQRALEIRERFSWETEKARYEELLWNLSGTLPLETLVSQNA